MSESLQVCGLQPTRLLCPWDFPGQDTGLGCHFLLQRIFPTQGSNLCLLHLLCWQGDSFTTVPPYFSIDEPSFIKPLTCYWTYRPLLIILPLYLLLQEASQFIYPYILVSFFLDFQDCVEYAHFNFFKILPKKMLDSHCHFFWENV